VDPLVAAYAFLSLHALLSESRSAAEPVLRFAA
jgi:hypothetical protein